MRKLAACVALPILSIPGIAILSGGAAAHMRALLAHTYAAHIAFVQLEAVVARTCGDWCVVSAEIGRLRLPTTPAASRAARLASVTVSSRARSRLHESRISAAVLHLYCSPRDAAPFAARCDSAVAPSPAVHAAPPWTQLTNSPSPAFSALGLF